MSLYIRKAHQRLFLFYNFQAKSFMQRLSSKLPSAKAGFHCSSDEVSSPGTEFGRCVPGKSAIFLRGWWRLPSWMGLQRGKMYLSWPIELLLVKIFLDFSPRIVDKHYMENKDTKKYPLPENTFLGVDDALWVILSLTFFVSTALFLFFVWSPPLQTV